MPTRRCGCWRDASDDEARALGGFSYTANPAVLHTDASMLPKRARARASWNYTTDDCRGAGGVLGMTYDLNRLQALDEAHDVLRRLNAGACGPMTIMREMPYDHPRYTFETLAAQQAVERINGARHTYFAGAHLGLRVSRGRVPVGRARGGRVRDHAVSSKLYAGQFGTGARSRSAYAFTYGVYYVDLDLDEIDRGRPAHQAVLAQSLQHACRSWIATTWARRAPACAPRCGIGWRHAASIRMRCGCRC